MVPVVPPDPSGTPPEIALDLHDAQVVADLLNRAAAVLLGCRQRRGGLVCLPHQGVVVMTGDLHDHHLNLHRIVKLAALHESDQHHLILHEIIHGPYRVNGRDTSIRTLARVASLVLQYPSQVHLMLANHELAQFNGEGIIKHGANVVEAFDMGTEYVYGDLAPMIHQAVHRFVSSLPLAVLCPNGIFCSHSLPSPLHLDTFDTSVIQRVPTPADLTSGGHAYRMVWGRRHTDRVAQVLGQAWHVNLFVMGHQPASMGYDTQGQSMLILASDHEHGVVLPINLSETYDRAKLIDRLVPLASVGL